MTELKQKIIALVEKIPDERTDVLTKIIGDICEFMDDDLRQDEIFSRAEQDLALLEDIESLTREGGDRHGQR